MPAPVKLHELAGITVNRCAFAPNEARILEVEHAVKIDSGAILAEGTQVEFEDVDLGYIFRGKIVEVEKAYESGEGVTYKCADIYRTLAKTPAKKSFLGLFSSKLKIAKGVDVNDALDSVLATAAPLLPGGVANSLPDGNVTPQMDKGGQSIDSWMDDLLELTPAGIAWVDPNAGAPKLIIEDFEAAPAVTLVEGTYNVITPAPGQLLLTSGRIGKTLNRKYKKYTMEGGGIWSRHVDQWIPATLEFADHAFGIYRYNWYVPESKITSKYVQADGTCAEGLRMKFRVGGTSGSAIERVIDNPPFSRDSQGRIFFWLYVFMDGITFTGTWTPPQVEAWFTYTSYDGPLAVASESADPALENEGELWEDHCEYYRFNSDDFSVDPTAELTALAEAAHARFSGVDTSGSLNIHIKGLNPNLRLGSSITNFGGARVRGIEYNIPERTMVIQISSVPIRENVSTAKLAQMLGTLPRNSWFAAREKEGCFCGDLDTLILQDGVPVDATENLLGHPPGNPVQPGAGPVGGGANDLPWDCQWNTPVNVGKGGRWKTEDEARRAGCNGQKRWHYVKCAGCMEVDDLNAQYKTFDECHSAHPGDPCNDADCQYNCDPGQGCVCAEHGTYANKAACLAACNPPSTPGGTDGGVGGTGTPAGVGSGPVPNPDPPGPKNIGCCELGHLEDQLPVLTCIKIDAHGRVIDFTCDVAAAAFVGITQEITRVNVCDVYCDEDTLVVKKQTETETKVNGVTTAIVQGECEE